MCSATVASCFLNVGGISRPLGSDAFVKAVNWERVIEIERNELRSGEAFKEQIPPDAIEVTRKGRTKLFTYKVRQWALDRTLRANGTDHLNIHWPA
ncbi:MAG TPA: hypothetical protein VFO35_12210, partial [Steroidobacteraceae bacterium]|nr:hypothetical protein [Steroidobacteraceae bacterium]